MTYGAGGTTRERTHATVKRIVDETSLKPAAHLTCVGATRAEIEQVVLRALAKDREERYQRAGDLLTDLRNARKRLEDPGARHTATRRRAPSRPKRRLIRIGIVAAAVIVLVVLALIFNPFNLDIGVQKNFAGPNTSIAVIGFENIPDPADREYTGESLASLLTTALFEAKGLEVISRERLYDIQKEMGPLPAPGTRAQLEQCVAELHAQLLDRSRPMWSVAVIEGLRSIASRVTEFQDMPEYYWGLLLDAFFSLKLAKPNTPKWNRSLLLSSLLCSRLEQWGNEWPRQ